MMEQDKAAAVLGKTFVLSLDEQFARLHARSRALVELISPVQLYMQPRRLISTFPLHSCAEHRVPSAAAVEQTCGGLAENLWDDPFEWTLPEALSPPERVPEYLDEVESTRRRG